MNKAHNNINWENYPSGNTPINDENLNEMDNSIDIIDNRVIALDTTKATKEEVAPLISDVQFNESTGTFTITRKNGSLFVIDTKLEKIAINWTYDVTTQQIILTLDDGTNQYIDLSALITQYEFLDTDTINFQVQTDGTVKAIVKDGSITEDKLQPNYLAQIKVESAKAQISEANAANSAKKAESWAHGNTGVRPEESTNNSKYWSEQSKEYADSWKGSLLPQGTIAFSQIPTSENIAGHMYNINEGFVTDSRFKDGAGYSYPAGTNVYWTQDGKWDCLSGTLTRTLTQAEYNNLTNAQKMNGTIYYIVDGDNSLPSASKTQAGLMSPEDKKKLDDIEIGAQVNTVLGVKGNAETLYRTGNINIMPENIGAANKSGDEFTGDVIFDKYLGIKAYPNYGSGVAKIWYNGNTKTLCVQEGVQNINLNATSANNADTVDGKHASDLQNYNNLTNKPTIPAAVRVKGNAEASYRTGDVNITPQNIGAVAKSGDTMSGTLVSSKVTQTHLDGNKGHAIINSTANAGDYTMLDKLNSTNGYFTDGVWGQSRVFFYTSKSTVDASSNSYTKMVTLLDESGNSHFPGTVIASTFSGNATSATNADTVDGKHASDFVSKSGDEMTGDLRVPVGRSSRNMSVPCCGRIDGQAAINDITDFSKYKTFLGSYYDKNNIWHNIISIRHGNGSSDGQNYGMYLKSYLTAKGDLSWGKQIGPTGGWQEERILLDSSNYKNYCTPANIGALPFRELTQVQYNLLSNTEKVNGTLYFITDAN